MHYRVRELANGKTNYKCKYCDYTTKHISYIEKHQCANKKEFIKPKITKRIGYKPTKRKGWELESAKIYRPTLAEGVKRGKGISYRVYVNFTEGKYGIYNIKNDFLIKGDTVSTSRVYLSRKIKDHLERLQVKFVVSTRNI